jgi:hypothetical protein
MHWPEINQVIRVNPHRCLWPSSLPCTFAPLALLLPLLLCWPQLALGQLHSFSRHQMGTQVQVLVWSPEAKAVAAGAERAFAEISRVEDLMSEWKEYELNT